MIQIEAVYQVVEEWIEDKPLFLVDVRISSDNSIAIELDSKDGVPIDTCVELSHYIETKLNRETEDYELEVGSSGLGQPFKVLKQYEKNIGNEVEVLTKDGKKWQGVLKSFAKETFVVEIEKQIKPEGAKRKITVKEEITFLYEQIKYTKYLIRFK